MGLDLKSHGSACNETSGAAELDSHIYVND